MTFSRITSKGQITIPKEVRVRMGLREGDEVGFVEDKGNFLLRKKVDREAMLEAIEKARASLVPEFFEMTVDEIMEELRGPPLTEEDIAEFSQDADLVREAIKAARSR